MQLEEKYLVLKRAEIQAALNEDEQATFNTLVAIVRGWRSIRGKSLDNRYLVVNADEPYFPELVRIVDKNTTVTHWITALDALEAGLEGDKEKCRAYAELWLEKLQADGETRIASSLQRILEGKRGKILYFAQTNVPAEYEVTRQVTIDTLTVTVTYPGWWEERHLEDWLLLIVQGACVIEVGERVVLAENDVPDLAYDAGGTPLTSVTELARLQQVMR